ncbi:MAG: hypothetical protein ACXAC7_13965 [Candidatus Hodarchaeales archaeon]
MAECNIENCENEASRTISKVKLGPALVEENLKLNIRPKLTKAKLCKVHYRRLKKHMKKADKLDRLRWK